MEAGHATTTGFPITRCSATAWRIDKVAKGTYYFDHSAGADLAARYEVRTVDGAGNASARVCRDRSLRQPARIVDGAPGAGISNIPAHGKRQVEPAARLCRHPPTSKEKGATAEVAFEGKRVLWFRSWSRRGKAAVSVDGGPAEIVDTYSADDIWGVCVYRKGLPASRSGTRCGSRSLANTVPRQQIGGCHRRVSHRRVVQEINVRDSWLRMRLRCTKLKREGWHVPPTAKGVVSPATTPFA